MGEIILTFVLINIDITQFLIQQDLTSFASMFSMFRQGCFILENQTGVKSHRAISDSCRDRK
jgi:hypothetical protein